RRSAIVVSCICPCVPSAAGARSAAARAVTSAGVARGARLLQTHAAPAIVAARVLADQRHSGPVECLNDFGQRLDHATNATATRLHALDGRQRNTSHGSQRFLIDPEQRSRGTHLE